MKVFYKKTTEDKAEVILIYHIEPPEYLLANPYIEVDEIPEPQTIEGKDPVMYVNPVAKEIFYEYVDIPKTQEQLLEERMSLMQQAIDDLILGGAL